MSADVSEQPLASSRVELSLDFDDLDDELERDLNKRFKKTAAAAEKTLDRIPQASKKAGQAVAGDLGDGAESAGKKIKKVVRQIEADLSGAGDAAGDLGDDVEASGGRAAAALARVTAAARDTQGALFDIGDSGGFVEIRQQVEAVQGALFDLDTVEIERIEQTSDRAAVSLRSRLADGVRRVGSAIVSLGRQRKAAGLDELGTQAERVGQQVERSGNALNRYTGRLGLLVSAIAAAAAAAPVLVSAGAGIGAVLALSVPSIVAVVQGTKEMADRWDGLSRQQKIAASSTQQLIDRYKEVSKAIEPSTLRAYNAAVGETIALLPRLAPLAETTADALTRSFETIGQGFDSDRGRGFFDFLESSAGPAVDTLTDLTLDLGAAFASTVQALAPLAGGVIGLVSGLLQLITALNDLNPGILQVGVLALALRAPLSAAHGLFTKNATKANTFAAAAGKASSATKVLNAVTAFGPNVYLAAGTALAFIAINALTAGRAIDSQINSVNALNKAYGNNVKGYEAANKVLAGKLIPLEKQLAVATTNLGRETNFTNLELAKGALAMDDLAGSPLRAAMDANTAAVARVNEAAAQLVTTGLAPSIASARRLAEVAGVDLSKALDESGNLSASAAGKIAIYASSVRRAGDTTVVLADAWERAKDEGIGLEAQAAALQEVFAKFLDPALGLLDASNNLRQVQQDLNKAFKEGNVSSLERSVLLSREVTALKGKLNAEQLAKGATKQTTAEVLRLLPSLERLARGNKDGQASLYALARSLDGATEDAAGAVTVIDRLGNRIKVLPDGKVIKLRADGKQAFGVIGELVTRLETLENGVQVPVTFVQRGPGLTGRSLQSFLPGGATGGLLNRGEFQRFASGGSGLLRGPGTGTSDSILARLSNREFVVNAKATRRHLALLQAINSNRFASGGLVGALPAFATGGQVRRAPQVNINALIGAALAAGLTGDRKALATELERLRKSLETKIVSIGQTVGVGFVKSITGSKSQINTAFTTLEKQISRAFVGLRTRVDDQLINRLERLNSRLATLSVRRDAILKAIEDAQEFASSTTSEARQFAGLSSFDDDQRASGVTIEQTLRARLAQIKKFAGDVQDLAGRGLDKSLLRQIIEGGPEEGGALAQTLRGASRTTLFQINALQARIDAATKDLGTDSADLLFDAGEQAGRGFLSGLQAQRKDIIALMTEIAESVSKTVRKTLKISSPSRVLYGDAEDSALGYIRGWQRLRQRVQAEIAQAVRPGREVERASALLPPRAADVAGARASSRAASASAARQVTVNQTNNIHAVTDPNAIASVVEGRLVAALR